MGAPREPLLRDRRASLLPRLCRFSSLRCEFLQRGRPGEELLLLLLLPSLSSEEYTTSVVAAAAAASAAAARPAGTDAPGEPSRCKYRRRGACALLPCMRRETKQAGQPRSPTAAGWGKRRNGKRKTGKTIFCTYLGGKKTGLHKIIETERGKKGARQRST